MAVNLIDRIVGLFSPVAGLRRVTAREMLQRAYEGASPRDGWRPRRAGASANADHFGDATALRHRARALVQNVPYVARGLESLVSNTVGTGIVPRSLAGNAARVDALWAEWGKVCDADGRFDIYGLQAAAYRAMEQDGEVLIRIRPRRREDGLPVPLQLQLLEIDWLDTTRNFANGGNQVINGIEYDALGRVAGYYLYDSHPGDLRVQFTRANSTRIPAGNVIHLFAPQRPGQGRGFSRLAPVIARVRDLQLYEDAEIARKNLETRLSVLASGDASQMSLTESASLEEVRTTGELGTLASGGIQQVPAGVNLTVVEPKAAPGYVEYVKYQLHLIAAGMGVTYEMLTGDVREVNFSSARVALLEFRRNAEAMQWLTVIPKMCDPIWRAFVDAAVLDGTLRQAEYGVDWSTPKWQYVNPEQDVRADLAEISGGLCSISEKLRQRGYKPELVFAEMKADFERLQADGTLDYLMFLQKGALPNDQAASAASAADSAARSVSFDVRSYFRDLSQQVDILRAEVSRPAPSINVNVPEREVHVAAPQVRVDSPTVNVAAPEVHVAAPDVRIEPTPVHVEVAAPEVRVDVAAPDVRVEANLPAPEVTVNLPDRVRESTVEYDGKGRIVKTTQTEKDL